MLRATKDIKLPTTITGSLPRPSWYTKNIGTQSFVEAMVNSPFREQYTDTVAVYLHEQEIAGLDIVTDGDAHFHRAPRAGPLRQASGHPQVELVGP